MDENFTDEPSATGGTAFSRQVRRVATLLHDAFDGHGRAVSVPSDACHWDSTPLQNIWGNTTDISDESVALSGSDLKRVFYHWSQRGSTLRESSFLGGVAKTAGRARSQPASDLQPLFASLEHADLLPELRRLLREPLRPDADASAATSWRGADVGEHAEHLFARGDVGHALAML